MKKFFIAIFIAALGLITVTTVALAHAKLDKCEPAVGSSNAVAPTQVRCWFTEELDTQQSTLAVTNSKNESVDNNDAKVDLNDKEHKQLVVTLKPSLPQDVYKVAWKAVSQDDKFPSEGDFSFGVGAVTVPQTTSAPAPAAGASGPDAMRTYITAALVIAAAAGIGYVAKMVLK